MKRIDFEAHFITPEYVSRLFGNTGYPRYVEDKETKARLLYCFPDTPEPLPSIIFNKLLNLEEERLKDMDAAGVDVQILSLAPGVELLDPAMGAELARKMNDILVAVIRRHPDRFMGFASLAPKLPEGAADELERAIKELGFKGWKTNSNFGDSYLDDEQYWPILARAEKLDVPIYLHPATPAIPQMRKYGFELAGPLFGFGAETLLCLMRLILSGAFDRFPGLRIIVGHLGEGVPFILERIDFFHGKPFVLPGVKSRISKRPSEYIKNNVFVTTSGNYYPPAFMCTYQALGIDRILLATDYPYEDSKECIRFLEGLALSQKEKDQIYSLNARRLGISG
jgi:predicted TIM-barrel fold metal-dependent hydrolase